MCTVSMIGDDWNRRFPESFPKWPFPAPNPESSFTLNFITKEEFDRYKRENALEFEKLRAELTSLKELLKAAKIYDEQTGQPNCELDEKIALLKKIAELVGVDLKDVFK